jgi:CDP-paratose 2-epimerase
MKTLITGICGFVGSSLAVELKRQLNELEVVGMDNLSRPGSELNRQPLKASGVRVLHGDIRNPSDLEALPRVDWVIDAAANPSVLAGVTGQTSSRQLMEHNLFGTVHLLEYCKRHGSGLVLLSSSRVYSQARLAALPMESRAGAFVPRLSGLNEAGLSARGVSEGFSTEPPISLYGSAKLASEAVALEYGSAFNFPVHVNRCGPLAGAGQFGKADQGIFSFWVHSYRQKRPLKYIGFDGTGCQVRDCFHPRDLAMLVAAQLRRPGKTGRSMNVSGGTGNSMSLWQLTQWCARRFGAHHVGTEPTPRQFDVPWLVLDCQRAETEWNWRPGTNIESILEEIARHADQHPGWLDHSAD